MPIAQMPAFDPDDVSLLLQALEGLQEAAQQMYRATSDPITRNSAGQSLELVRSAASKLKKQSTEFTLDEVKTMYLALSEWKESLNDMLDTTPASDELRPVFQQSLRASNGLIRRLKGFLHALEIDVDDLLAMGRSAL